MKILTAEEIRNWDQYTIEHEPISSIDLMERAASEVTDWILDHYPNRSYSIFCGKGNNGGDGLAVARMLLETNPGSSIKVFILEFGAKGTDDFQVNLSRLHLVPGADIHFIQTVAQLPVIGNKELIIDALFGTGMNRGLEGLTAQLVAHLNNSGTPIVSVDIPSGLLADTSTGNMITVRATHTLSFQCYKPAFLFPENADAIGELHILDIGLLPGYLDNVRSKMEFITKEQVRALHKKRNNFAHKGNFGHALLLAGSYGKMGAAVLAAKACIRSGVGLLTVHIPTCGYAVLQSMVPEAMVSPDQDQYYISRLEEKDLDKYLSIGIGPGIGMGEPTRHLLGSLMERYKQPLVIDADGLNIISSHPKLFNDIPRGSILTPHPKEFERLFGPANNDFERASLAQAKATELNCVIVLKGHYTLVAMPASSSGSCFMYFNNTGNPGMAKGGSGDVLTGLLTGLLAQGYSSFEAALLGVYLHGMAGDIAAEKYSMDAMTASDIIENIPEAFIATF